MDRAPKHLLTDHLDAAAKNPDLHIQNPHLHKTVENPDQYQRPPHPLGTAELTIHIKKDPETTAYITSELQEKIQKQINQIYNYDQAIYVLNILTTAASTPGDVQAEAEIITYLKNPEHVKPTLTKTEKIIQWINNKISPTN